jgi:hypothetical protein
MIWHRGWSSGVDLRCVHSCYDVLSFNAALLFAALHCSALLYVPACAGSAACCPVAHVRTFVTRLGESVTGWGYVENAGMCSSGALLAGPGVWAVDEMREGELGRLVVFVMFPYCSHSYVTLVTLVTVVWLESHPATM